MEVLPMKFRNVVTGEVRQFDETMDVRLWVKYEEPTLLLFKSLVLEVFVEVTMLKRRVEAMFNRYLPTLISPLT
jgi:hypothetical protein